MTSSEKPICSPITIARQDLVCPLCRLEFLEPKMLPCCHTFCRMCIATECAVLYMDRYVFWCPTCYDESEAYDVTGFTLPPNIYITGLQEVQACRKADKEYCLVCSVKKRKSSAAYKCLDCGDKLCQTCSRGHNSSTTTSNHFLACLSDLIKGRHDMQIMSRQRIVCLIHRENYKLYCTTCSILICERCALDEHRTHLHKSIEEAVQERKTALEKVVPKNFSVSQIKKRLSNLDKEEKQFNKKLMEETTACVQQIQMESKQMRKKCHEFFQKERAMLSNHLSSLSTGVFGMYNKVMECGGLQVLVMGDALEAGMKSLPDDVVNNPLLHHKKLRLNIAGYSPGSDVLSCTEELDEEEVDLAISSAGQNGVFSFIAPKVSVGNSSKTGSVLDLSRFDSTKPLKQTKGRKTVCVDGKTNDEESDMIGDVIVGDTKKDPVDNIMIDKAIGMVDVTTEDTENGKARGPEDDKDTDILDAKANDKVDIMPEDRANAQAKITDDVKADVDVKEKDTVVAMSDDMVKTNDEDKAATVSEANSADDGDGEDCMTHIDIPERNTGCAAKPSKSIKDYLSELHNEKVSPSDGTGTRQFVWKDMPHYDKVAEKTCSSKDIKKSSLATKSTVGDTEKGDSELQLVLKDNKQESLCVKDIQHKEDMALGTNMKSGKTKKKDDEADCLKDEVETASMATCKSSSSQGSCCSTDVENGEKTVAERERRTAQTNTRRCRQTIKTLIYIHHFFTRLHSDWNIPNITCMVFGRDDSIYFIDENNYKIEMVNKMGDFLAGARKNETTFFNHMTAYYKGFAAVHGNVLLYYNYDMIVTQTATLSKDTTPITSFPVVSNFQDGILIGNLPRNEMKLFNIYGSLKRCWTSRVPGPVMSMKYVHSDRVIMATWANNGAVYIESESQGIVLEIYRQFSSGDNVVGWHPWDACVTVDGRVIVSDSLRNEISIFDQEGNLLYSRNTAERHLLEPRCLLVDKTNRVFVSGKHGTILQYGFI
ncbi:uncharacterized protein LOC124141328 [Haliotis rufescens]|uniref:uncharacterized protein LOC124141328 n=1 Tax=Haliotis rufescens TaxID=6454 RepID=UPI001EB08D3A|nr:uncharacterized protein LOC124141328 [Haliotis rufescens]